MKYIFFILFYFLSSYPAFSDIKLSSFIFENSKIIIKSSSKTVDRILSNIDEFNDESVSKFLSLWKDKKLYYIKKTKEIVLIKKFEKKKYIAVDIFTNDTLGNFSKKDFKKIKPNSGVRSKISSALVKFQIFNENPKKRLESIKALEKKILSEHLEILRKASLLEEDITLKARIQKLLKIGILEYGTSDKEKINILGEMGGDTSIEIRAALSKLLRSSEIKITNDIKKLEKINVARIIVPEKTTKNEYGETIPTGFFNNKAELNIMNAYQIAEKKGFVKKRVTLNEIKNVLEDNIQNKEVLNVPINELNSDARRIEVYNKLANKKKLTPYKTHTELKKDLNDFNFYTSYLEKSKEVTEAAKKALSSINLKVAFYKYIDLFVDGLSLASIYFLGAIGLAITFGVMRVINMAHGEFIMMGAYTGYVVQLYISNHTLSLIIAFPLAFIVTFLAGIIMERFVIRYLYKNPLDTLLATFGISIALQQLAKNIFGTQARPLTSPSWLDGSLTVNDDLSISYIRIAIFILGIIFFLLLLFVMNKTRFGVETRSVTQNPIMASNMGINPEKINMLTFGFGSGIAGIAGVAIGLFSKVTSELGSEYIVQSFMTVVVGGVGNIWGTLAGASLIGFLQKLIEWFNPSNTLAAQTYMIIFIILFIQFRPRGLIALKGRASNE